MSLKILRQQFMDRLLSSIGQNDRQYKLDKPWIEHFAEQSLWFIDTSLEPADELELLEPDGVDLKDLENSIRLYKALSFLT